MTLDRAEVARYLGDRQGQSIVDLEPLIADCEQTLLQNAAPRRLGRRVLVASLAHESRDLARHLQDATEVWLMAVTLGSEADRLLRLWSAQSMAKAAIGQALAAVYMDACCDAYHRELETHMEEGEYLLPAYSPGYGDFSLAWQEPLLRLLDAGRRIGLSLTEGGMLVPEKSVTAVLGITHTPSRRCAHHCQNCTMTHCIFRKGT